MEKNSIFLQILKFTKIFSLGMKRFFFLSIFFFSFLEAKEAFYDFDDDSRSLFRDLEIVDRVNKRMHDSLPVIYNYQMQGGYFAMPSARMPKTGTLGFGFAHLPPYHLYAASFQLFDRLEVQGNYWIYKGQIEPHFGVHGFGDDAERSANAKYALLKKEDGIPFLPEISLGLNDFIGTRRFFSFYAVATQCFLDYDLELSAGWGTGRIHGFFFGGAWTPFRKANNFFKGLSLLAEYDVNNYRNPNEHLKGREVKSRLNAGIHWTLFDHIHLSASTIRGKKFAAAAQYTYNFGETKGIFPKIYDPLPYSSPVDNEPLGMIRTDKEFAQELAYAFKEQGFDLYTVLKVPGANGESELWMKVINVRYWEENVVRLRLQEILAALTPSNIDNISVVIESDGIPIQEYRFERRI